MNPNQYPKVLPNVVCSQLFPEICTKTKNIVFLPLFFHRNDMILPGFATVQSLTSTAYKKYQLDLRWSC